MSEHTIYRVSSFDPLRGLGAQNTDMLLVTSVEDGERYVRNLYAGIGYPEAIGALRQVGDEPLWAMDAQEGREWFIALTIVHQSECPILERPVGRLEDDRHAQCTCGQIGAVR